MSDEALWIIFIIIIITCAGLRGAGSFSSLEEERGAFHGVAGASLRGQQETPVRLLPLFERVVRKLSVSTSDVTLFSFNQTLEDCHVTDYSLLSHWQVTDSPILYIVVIQAPILLRHGFRVPGEIKRSRDLRGGRWSWTLTFAQKRSWVGRWSWAEQVGLLLLRVVQVVRQQRCNGHCLVTLSSTAVETATAQCTSLWAMARGHLLNTSIVLAAVHGLSGLFRAVSAVEPFTLLPASRSVPVPNRPTRLCGRKARLNLKAWV